MTNWIGRLAALALAAATAACTGSGYPPADQAQPAPGDILVEEFMVGTKDKGVDLYLRNKHRADLIQTKAERTVLFVHGASYPAHSTFDLALDGTSWMDWLAKRGYDVYSVDLRGYGRSTRPPAMKQSPAANPPVGDTTQAVEDLTRVVEFVVSRRNLSRLVLVGWSWGGTVVGSYTTEAPNRVERLVLYAPQWLREQATPAAVEPGKLGAWRLVEPRGARERWLMKVPEAKREDVLPKSWFNAWTAATLASDPDSGDKAAVRAPNGVVADTLSYWAAGRPRWEPSRISVPTLVIQGEWDAEAPPAMGQGLFARLTGAPARRYVMLGEATHAALLEKNRLQLFKAVQNFLEEPLP